MYINSQFIWGSRLLISLLNSSVAELDNPATMGVDLICNKVRYILLLASRHFIVHFTNLYMLWTDHCTGGDRTLSWPVLCSSSCKIFCLYNVCMSSMDMHIGIVTDVLMWCMLMFMPVIFLVPISGVVASG